MFMLIKRLKFVIKKVGNSWWDKIQKGKAAYKVQKPEDSGIRKNWGIFWRLIEKSGFKQFNMWLIREVDRLNRNEINRLTIQSPKKRGSIHSV